MERPTKYARVQVASELPPRISELMSQRAAPPVPPTYKPILHIEDYVRGMEPGLAEKYRMLYTPPPEPEYVPIERVNVPSDPMHVFTTLKVLKNGTVRIKCTVPMEPVYASYAKGKMPSLDVRIRAAKGFGYPDDVLARMIETHDAKKANMKKLDMFIDEIFGKSIQAKTNKPKKKTVQEILNSKFKKKPLKKFS